MKNKKYVRKLTIVFVALLVGGLLGFQLGKILSQSETPIKQENFVFSGTSFPGSPVEGQVFYRTDLDVLYVYNGASWDALEGSDGVGGYVMFDYLIFKNATSNYLVNGKTLNIDWNTGDDDDIWNAATGNCSSQGYGLIYGIGNFDDIDNAVILYDYITISGPLGKERQGYTSSDGALIFELADGANCNVFESSGVESKTMRYCIVLKNLAIDGNRAGNTAGNATYLCVQQSEIRKVQVHNMDENGFVFRTPSGGYAVLCKVVDCRLNSGDEHAIAIGNYPEFWLVDNDIGSWGYEGIKANYDSLGGGADWEVRGNFIYGCRVGIYITENYRSRFYGNGIDENNQEGLILSSGGDKGEHMVTANMITRNGQDANNTYANLKIDNSWRNIIVGNAISWDTHANKPKYGVYITGSIGDDNIVTDNYIDYGMTAGIRVDSGCQDNDIRGNHYGDNNGVRVSDAGTGTLYLRKISFGVGQCDFSITAYGRWTAANLRDTADDNCRFVAFAVPEDFYGLDSVRVVCFSTGSGNVYVQEQVSYAGDGEDYNANDGASGWRTEAITADDMTVLTDFSSLLSGVAVGDYVGIQFGRQGTHASDTVSASLYVVLVEIVYEPN